MRAAVIDEFGGTVRLADVPVPELGPGQALVRVAYASINPADWKCREGWLRRFPAFRPAFPFVLGFDGSGTVERLGPDTDAPPPGGRVFIRANQMLGWGGTFAEFVRVTVDGLQAIPDGVPMLDAAAMPTAGVTAWQSLHDAGGLAAGQRVMVNGGAGGTGSYAIQFARTAGARVAATCSAGNLDHVRGLGAELAIDYRSQDVAAAVAAWAPGGVDLLLDTVNLGSLPDAIGMVRPGGVLVGIATLDDRVPPWDAEAASRRGVRLAATTANRATSAADMASIAALMASGQVRSPVTEVLDLAQAEAALARIAAGHVRGKLILAVNPGR
jgi:NADPH:quinone reductase-like Zn-dependent oxidoreductase